MCLRSSNELQQERQRAPPPGSGCYLCYFEELRYPSHASEELLVDVQAFFTLGLLHVKVFLCCFFFWGRVGKETTTGSATATTLLGSLTFRLRDIARPMEPTLKFQETPEPIGNLIG